MADRRPSAVSTCLKHGRSSIEESTGAKLIEETQQLSSDSPAPFILKAPAVVW